MEEKSKQLTRMSCVYKIMEHKQMTREEAERHFDEFHAHCKVGVCPWMPVAASGERRLVGDPQEEESRCKEGR
jgi:hypothetical protein